MRKTTEEMVATLVVVKREEKRKAIAICACVCVVRSGVSAARYLGSCLRWWDVGR